MNALKGLLMSLKGMGNGILGVAKDDVLPGAVWMLKLLGVLIMSSILLSIVAVIVLISGADQTTPLAILLGMTILTVLASWIIVGLATETLRLGFLAATIAKTLAVDSSIGVMLNAGKALIAVGGLGVAATTSIMRLTAAAVPGVNLDEVNAAFGKSDWNKVEWAPVTDAAKTAIFSAVEKFGSYGRRVKSIFTGWLLILAVAFLGNVMGLPEFFNVATNSFLTIFVIITAICMVVKQPEQRSRTMIFWYVISSGVVMFLIWRVIKFYFLQT